MTSWVLKYWRKKNYGGNFLNVKNRSPTSQSLHQDKLKFNLCGIIQIISLKLTRWAHVQNRRFRLIQQCTIRDVWVFFSISDRNRGQLYLEPSPIYFFYRVVRLTHHQLVFCFQSWDLLNILFSLEYLSRTNMTSFWIKGRIKRYLGIKSCRIE